MTGLHPRGGRNLCKCPKFRTVAGRRAGGNRNGGEIGLIFVSCPLLSSGSIPASTGRCLCTLPSLSSACPKFRLFPEKKKSNKNYPPRSEMHHTTHTTCQTHDRKCIWQGFTLEAEETSVNVLNLGSAFNKRGPRQSLLSDMRDRTMLPCLLPPSPASHHHPVPCSSSQILTNHPLYMIKHLLAAFEISFIFVPIPFGLFAFYSIGYSI